MDDMVWLSITYVTSVRPVVADGGVTRVEVETRTVRIAAAPDVS